MSIFKDLILYNASDFPLVMRLRLEPHTGLKLEDLLELVRDHGEYVYLADSFGGVGEGRILTKDQILMSVG